MMSSTGNAKESPGAHPSSEMMVLNLPEASTSNAREMQPRINTVDEVPLIPTEG
jgi:hypothetical protein